MANLSHLQRSSTIAAFKRSLLLLPMLTSVAIGAEDTAPERKPFKLSIAQVSTQSAEVSDSNTELQRDTLLLNAGVNVPLNRQWSVGINFGYDRLDYDWRNINLTGANNVSSLFGADGQAWDDINRYRAGVSLTYRLDKHWAFFLAPQLQYAYADTASFNHAQSYGVVASAMYVFDFGNMIGFGVAYLNDIDEVRTVPYLAMRWQINDNWALANPFKAGFSGPAGLELSYQFNSDWNIGFGSSKRTERFLIEDDDTAVEINEWVGYVRGGWQATPAVSVNLYAGYYFNGELEVTRQAAVDMDNQGAAALDIEFKF
ncbi:DUF6268 family outer membrane beta-barrel protein [Shewanella putrefaciens]|uniref:DUF6268 family outer membrane beta-barrel protein n=1 Tax=Shewanella putrefaciens TaxID=24 RepID=UPI00242F29F0|nr:DUF6268 family outer membrane beta-barrel protein [Shewanella putrefaciens]MCA1896347.1 DUF6268 family outer membrane beta-barrel protein [Shewanella putrefaciens]